jgi:hypothetical protein
MRVILRNSLALIIGLAIGSAVNMGLIIIGPSIIPPPAGVDVTNMESLQSSMHLFEPRHFLIPFLAHALGTLVGAFVASLVAVSHRMKLAFGVGGMFLLGGISNLYYLPSPVWFAVLDILAAYLPMAWLGDSLRARIKGNSSEQPPQR